MTVRRKHIGRLAQTILAENKVEAAPVDVFAIAGKLNLDVKKQKADDELSGFLYRNPRENTNLIGVNRLHTGERQRFTVAHEIGHFLLHNEDVVHVDKGQQIKRRDAKSKEGTDVEEMEANLFAAELLMPESFLIRDLAHMNIDLHNDAAITKLARKYQVSTQALGYRLAYLGFA